MKNPMVIVVVALTSILALGFIQGAKIAKLEKANAGLMKAIDSHTQGTNESAALSSEQIRVLNQRIDLLEKADHTQEQVNNSHARLIHRLYRGSF